MGKKRVYLRAYVAGNFGDDLFIRIVCERYPTVQFWMVGSQKYCHSFDDVPNLHYVKNDTLIKKILRKGINIIGGLFDIPFLKYFSFDYIWNVVCCRKFDMCLLVSGSYFIEWTDDLGYWDYYFNMEKNFYSTAPCVLDINFGPYKREKYLEFYLNEMKKACFLSVRDKKTLYLLKESGAIYAPDMVFLYDKTRNIPYKHHNKYIVVSVFNNMTATDEYYKKMYEIEEYAYCKGYDVVLLSMCKSEGDEKTIEALYKNSQKLKDRISIFEYGKKKIEEVVGLIAEADLVIAGRYHTMIISWVCNTIVVPICYSIKMVNVIQDLAKKCRYYTVENIQEMTGEEVFDTKLYEIPDVQKIKKLAEVNFKYLDIRFHGL